MATSDPDASAVRQEVAKALNEIVERGQKSGRKYFRSARRWERLHYSLGSLAVVLAAISGGTGLASAAGRVPAAVTALASGAVAGLTTFFGSEKRSHSQDVKAASWFELKDAAQNMLRFRIHDAIWLKDTAESDLNSLQSWQTRLSKGELSHEGQRRPDGGGPAIA